MHAPMHSALWRSLALAGLALAAASPVASAQLLEIDCAATNLVPTRLELTWLDVPTEFSLAALSDATPKLQILNRTHDVITYRLIGRLHAGGVRRTVQLGTGTLSPFGGMTSGINFDNLGIPDFENLAFSGRFSIEARSTNAVGELIDRAYSPVVFFHKTGGGASGSTLLVYGGEMRRLQFNYGDLLYQVHTSGVPDPTIIGIFDGGAGVGNDHQGHGPGLPTPPPINGNASGGSHAIGPGSLTAQPKWEFCMRWVYESIDSGFGEDHYVAGDLMKARGMKVAVDHINWPEPKFFNASNDNGCFSFYATENTGFRVVIFNEAKLGDDDANMTTVRAFDSLFQANLNDEDQVKKWIFIASPGGLPRRVYYENEPSELSNLMAFGSFVFHWVDAHTNPRLPGTHDLVLVTGTCSSGGSCQPGDQVRIRPGDTNRKFLVGHEVGHWLHRQWLNDPDNMGYDNWSWLANSSDPDCAFGGVGNHAMRSKEYSVAGFIEGFGHFVSALAWNSHNSTTGIFKYYKEVEDATYADMEADNWRIDLEGAGAAPLGGVSNWMENMCFVTDGHSVEMDWLRFYWDYRTNRGTKPSHHDIFEQIAFTREFHPWTNNLGAYDSLYGSLFDWGLGQVNHTTRFGSLAAANGVAQ